jgi:hypothetical protein
MRKLIFNYRTDDVFDGMHSTISIAANRLRRQRGLGWSRKCGEFGGGEILISEPMFSGLLLDAEIDKVGMSQTAYN